MGSAGDLNNLANLFSITRSIETERNKYRDQLIYDIEYLSGYNLETLKNMFVAGWTLTPPKNSETNIYILADALRKRLIGELYET